MFQRKTRTAAAPSAAPSSAPAAAAKPVGGPVVHQPAQAAAVAKPMSRDDLVALQHIADLDKVELPGQGRYLGPGFNGEVKITRVQIKTTQKGPAFIANLEVVECAPGAVDSDGYSVGPGDMVTFFQKLTEYPEQARQSMCLFTLAALGLDVNSATDVEAVKVAMGKMSATLSEVIDERQAAAGAIVHLTTKDKVKKHSEGNFTLYVFSPTKLAPAEG